MKNLDWIGFSISIAGTVLNANHNILCWPLWIIGNMFWIVHFYRIRQWAVLTLWIILEFVNVYGWYQWTI